MTPARPLKRVKRLVRRSVTRSPDALRAAAGRRRFASALLAGREDLDRYQAELRRSGLIEHLSAQASVFESTVGGRTERGRTLKAGGVGSRDGLYLYAAVRAVRPRIAVETGVCNGFSTAYLLQGLQANGEGRLFSIDLPDVVGEEYGAGRFWEGKGGAVIPPGRQPGWVIPDSLRERWELRLGPSQDLLPPLLREVGAIDLFLHDSEHSYECMAFEFFEAYAVLRDGGVLVSDDVNWNTSFFDFARDHGRRAIRFSPHMALLVK